MYSRRTMVSVAAVVLGLCGGVVEARDERDWVLSGVVLGSCMMVIVSGACDDMLC